MEDQLEENKKAHERRKTWLKVSADFEDLWDYAEKRVVSKGFRRDRSPYVWFIAAIYNLISYRRGLYLKFDDIDQKSNCNHVFMSVSTRPDHFRQEALLIEELKPKVYILDRAEKKIENSIKVSITKRASLGIKALRVAARAVKLGAISPSDLGSTLNMLTKFYIDRNIGKLISLSLKDLGGSIVVSCLSTEGLRGMMEPLRKSGIKIVAYQHGLKVDNHGYPEERLSDLYVLWTEKDRLKEIHQNNYISPPKLVVCPTHIPEIKSKKSVLVNSARIVYVSSPSPYRVEGDRGSKIVDFDELMMEKIVDRCEVYPIGSGASIELCLHPSKKKKDYPFLKKCHVYTSLTNETKGALGYIGVYSTALYNKALEGHRVAGLYDDSFVYNVPDQSVEGVRYININETKNLDSIIDFLSMNVIEDRVFPSGNRYGEVKAGALSVLIDKELYYN